MGIGGGGQKEQGREGEGSKGGKGKLHQTQARLLPLPGASDLCSQTITSLRVGLIRR